MLWLIAASSVIWGYSIWFRYEAVAKAWKVDPFLYQILHKLGPYILPEAALGAKF